MISNLDDRTLNRQAKYYKPQSAIKGAKLLNLYEKQWCPLFGVLRWQIIVKIFIGRIDPLVILERLWCMLCNDSQ